MKKSNGSTPSKSTTVPVIISGGITASIDTKQIDEGKWNHHHGKTSCGKQVNSLQSTKIGDSLLIRKMGNRGPTLSVTTAEFEVAAVQILGDMGYKLTAPSA